jgi:hypothetical protein
VATTLNGNTGYEFESTFLDFVSGIPNGQGRSGSKVFVAGTLL